MSSKIALRDLNNAILDLQQSDYNTYDRPLKRIAAILSSDALQAVVAELKAAVDFDAFLESAGRGGGMAGSATLNWPSDRLKQLGLEIVLVERGAADPHWFLSFAHTYFYSGSKIVGDIRKITSSVIIPFGRDFAAYVNDRVPNIAAPALSSDRTRIFVVHGRDEACREAVARFIDGLGLQPIILHEQANRGMTIPEKLSAYGDVSFAIVLLTPDDVGRLCTDVDDRPRARQNVVLELGYFVGRLGRERVCALLKGDVEIPSDYLGVVYSPFDAGGGWRVSLARELQAAGFDIDWNTVMR